MGLKITQKKGTQYGIESEATGINLDAFVVKYSVPHKVNRGLRSWVAETLVQLAAYIYPEAALNKANEIKLEPCFVHEFKI